MLRGGGLITGLLLGGCDAPTMGALQAGAGWWPQNSATAIVESLAAGALAIEVDLSLTEDQVPVLVELPYLDQTACRLADGAALSTVLSDDSPDDEQIWIMQEPLATLQEDYVCGGVAWPGYEDAALVDEPLLSLDGLIALLDDYTGTVYLDLRLVPNVSLPAEVYAAQVLERWWAADLDCELVVMSDLSELVVAVSDRATESGHTVQTALSWPRLSPAWPRANAAVFAGATLGADAGLVSGISDAEHAGADAIALYASTISRTQIQQARAGGLSVIMLAPDQQHSTSALSRWPVDAVLTAWPEL